MKKVSLVIAVVLSLMALPSAQPANSQANSEIFLPVVTKPECRMEDALNSGSAYSSSSAAVLRVGETMTVTGYLINDGCAHFIGAYTYVTGDVVLSPVQASGPASSTGDGLLFTAQFTFQAVSPGTAVIDVFTSWEFREWRGIHDGARAAPLTIRVIQ